MPHARRIVTKNTRTDKAFHVGDEVELLAWRIFGTRGIITSTDSSPFRHPFHVKTDLGHIVGVYPHEMRQIAGSEQDTTGGEPASLIVKKIINSGGPDDKGRVPVIRRRGKK